MGDPTPLEPAIETFSLYVDLEPGTKADLEAISRSALAFADAVRELAFIIDPSLDIRIEFVSGTEGSFSLNTWLRSLKPKDILSRKNLIAVAIVAASWFGSHARDWGYEKFLEHISGMDSASHLTEDEKRQIGETAAAAVIKKLADPQVQHVYRELQADPSIAGVGATHKPGHRPQTVVPRREFPERAGTAAHREETTTKRITSTREVLTLVSPVLLPGDRKWEFLGAQGKVSASIKDLKFLQDVIEARSSIRMVSGIQMDVDLETIEEFKSGVWQIQDRHILRVYHTTSPVIQRDLPFLPESRLD